MLRPGNERQRRRRSSAVGPLVTWRNPAQQDGTLLEPVQYSSTPHVVH
jgi:hypothetical protein